MRHGSFAAAAIAIALMASCIRYVRDDRRVTRGTCEGACRHYVDCRDDDDMATYSACIDECQDIYVTDGVADSESLRDYERLDCHAAVRFIEGDSGRRPGQDASRNDELAPPAEAGAPAPAP